jgi:hypothetical protein
MPKKERVAIPGFSPEMDKVKAMDAAELQAYIHGWAKGRGWWEDPNRPAGEIFMNIASEVAEAWEDWRENGKVLLYYVLDDNGVPKPEGAAIEFADVVIRIMDFMEREGYPLWPMIARKMAYNEQRPYRHGGKHA